jgi:hypothetical protein
MKKLVFIILSIFGFFATAFGQGNCREVAQANSDGLLVINRYSNGISKSGFITATFSGKSISLSIKTSVEIPNERADARFAYEKQ